MFQIKTNAKLFSVCLLLLQCAVFGYSFIVLKKLIAYGCPTFLLISIRFFIGAISLLFVSIVLPKDNILYFKLTRFEMVTGIISGFAMLLAFSLQTYGAYFTSSANNALFTGLYVIFVPILTFVYRKKFNCILLAYSFLSVIGVALVSGFSLISFSINLGDILSIICGVGFAIHFLLLETFTPNVNLSSFTVVQLLAVSIISGAISLLSEHDTYFNVNFYKALPWLFFMGIIATAITYLIQSYVQIHLPANTVSIISCSESVFAVVFSITLGYEDISLELFGGVLFIVLSMVLVTLYNNKNSLTLYK